MDLWQLEGETCMKWWENHQLHQHRVDMSLPHVSFVWVLPFGDRSDRWRSKALQLDLELESFQFYFLMWEFNGWLWLIMGWDGLWFWFGTFGTGYDGLWNPKDPRKKVSGSLMWPTFSLGPLGQPIGSSAWGQEGRCGGQDGCHGHLIDEKIWKDHRWTWEKGEKPKMFKDFRMMVEVWNWQENECEEQITGFLARNGCFWNILKRCSRTVVARLRLSQPNSVPRSEEGEEVLASGMEGRPTADDFWWFLVPRMRQKLIYGGQREFDPLMDFVVRTSVWSQSFGDFPWFSNHEWPWPRYFTLCHYVSLGFLMKFCEVENSVNLEDVEMADSVGKQASLAGSLGPQTALKFCCYVEPPWELCCTWGGQRTKEEKEGLKENHKGRSSCLKSWRDHLTISLLQILGVQNVQTGHFWAYQSNLSYLRSCDQRIQQCPSLWWGFHVSFGLRWYCIPNRYCWVPDLFHSSHWIPFFGLRKTCHSNF